MYKKKYTEDLFDSNIVLNNLNLSEKQIVLDVGCGSGYMTKNISNLIGKEGKAYGIDVDEQLILDINSEIKKPNTKFLCEDITKKTSFKNSYFDLIYLSTVFHIFNENQIAYFQNEIHRILKSKGTLAILNINEKASFGPSLDIRVSAKELRKKLSFNTTKIIDINEYFYMQLFEKN